MVAAGCPAIVTRAWLGIIVAGAPCGHKMLALRCNKLGIMVTSVVFGNGPSKFPIEVVDHVTTRATPLMDTDGPAMTMVAPLPFESVMPASFIKIMAPDRCRMVKPSAPSLMDRTF